MTREPPSRPAAPENVLLQTGEHDDCDESACMDLLGVAEPREVDVLFVTVTKSARERLDALKRHADAPPANVGIVSVQVGGSSGAAKVGGDGGPTVQRISDPSDLTGVGIAISEFLAAWGGDGNRTVVCFESLTALLQYVDASRVFQFCNEITSKCEQAGALAHFHITPGAHEPQVLNVLSSLFDSRVNAADLGHGSHAEEPTPTASETSEHVGEEQADDRPAEDANDPFEYAAGDPDPGPEPDIDEADASEAGTEPTAEPSEPESIDTEADEEAVEEIDLVDPRETAPDDDGEVAADDPGAASASDPADLRSSGAANDARASDVDAPQTDPEQPVDQAARETDADAVESGLGPSNEPADRPKKYALYQRTTATVVGVVAMLVLLSFFAAAMPLPVGTDAPGTEGAEVTPTPTPDSAAAADDADEEEATVTEAASTAEPTATPTATATAEPTPTARDTATASDTETATATPTPTPTAEPTATPEPTPTATEEDTSLTDGLEETTDGISDTLDGDEEDDGSLL